MNLSLINIGVNRWEIKKQERMLVPAKIYANSNILKLINKDNALRQIANVATLPGIVSHSIAMPDIHEGYGFPIGGVAATDIENGGVISPGGVGYDINCGIRVMKTDLFLSEVEHKTHKILERLKNTIPTGVGSKDAIKKLGSKDLHRILLTGAKWAVEMGFGKHSDLVLIEESGMMSDANPEVVSIKAKNRGIEQMGTLGSGNHFIEVGYVEEVYLPDEARQLGLRQNMITIMIHSGSRGLGHQVCSDFLIEMKRNSSHKEFYLADPQLISARYNSVVGKNYYGAMSAAANYAWANRQVMSGLAEKSLLEAIGIAEKELNYSLIYDVSHNIAKTEEHLVAGKKKRLCVHRKGATRAFPPNHPDIPQKYKAIGQPVIIPGDMGRFSYICLGTEAAMSETFGSSCHGAGRVMSRKETLRRGNHQNVLSELHKRNIIVHSATKSTLVEEMSSAYKDVSEVVATMTDSGLLRSVARLKPLIVVKG